MRGDAAKESFYFYFIGLKQDAAFSESKSMHGPLGGGREKVQGTSKETTSCTVVAGTISVLADNSDWETRPTASQPAQPMGTGREMFALMRAASDNAEAGASAMLAVAGL